MPLGNLTSQFFANVYLNELDNFVKHKLRAKYYIRYVDDFVILHKSKRLLELYKGCIDKFLRDRLSIELHPDKSKILPLYKGIKFLGFRIFYYNRLLNKMNIKKFERKFSSICEKYDEKLVDYDSIYDFLEGWFAYSKNADTYKLRQRIGKLIFQKVDGEISTKEINRHNKELERLQFKHVN